MAYNGRLVSQSSFLKSDIEVLIAKGGWNLSTKFFKLLARRFSSALTSIGMMLLECCTSLIPFIHASLNLVEPRYT